MSEQIKRCGNVMGLPRNDNWICLKKLPNSDESCDNPYDETCKFYWASTQNKKVGE